MAPRLSRTSVPSQRSSGPKSKNAPRPKPAQRKPKLDPLAAAEEQFPEKLGIRKTRLEGSDDEDDAPGPSSAKRRRVDAQDGAESDGTLSDGSGHAFHVGRVEDEDDSEIDSDDAFGESDEERFEDWAFRGSKSNQVSRRKNRARGGLEEGEDEDEEGSDLGSDAIDLAQALDEYESDGEGDEENESADGDEKYSESEPSEDGDENEKLGQLRTFVSAISNDATASSAQPSKPGKLSMADLLPAVTDKRLRDSAKAVMREPTSKKFSDGIDRKLSVPLPKRQQDRIDRAAANKQAKETLSQWVDTVQHNRRAEHVSFPLPQPDVDAVMGQSKTLVQGRDVPFNDLESTIRDILVQSGLSTAEGKDVEDDLQAFETLQEQKIPYAEVQARRAELRRQRDLLFREEMRAKRISKIKSKAYRRVHRKEKQRDAERQREELIAMGIDPDEDDEEEFARRRAEARVGGKVRDSKWAKGAKGRMAWDKDARDGVADLARRNDELNRRIAGERATSPTFSEDSGDDKGESGDEMIRLEGQLHKSREPQESSRLTSMKFMQRAEEANRAKNDEDVERALRELNEEESGSNLDEDAQVGRRKFGTSTKAAAPKGRPLSDTKSAAAVAEAPSQAERNEKESKARKAAQSLADSKRADQESVEEENPFLTQPVRKKSKSDAQSIIKPVGNGIQQRPASASSIKGKPKQIKTNGKKSSKASAAQDDSFDINDSNSEDEDPGATSNAQRQRELRHMAFAGDDLEMQFENEKKALVEDEGDKIIDNTLPGWGSWVGEGLSKKEKKRNHGRFLMKQEGVKPQQRADAKLDRVLISEKKTKKTDRYLATNLPYPFETRAQYERSLRLPVGPEWSTRDTFQKATKPRVLVKQGIIAPMERPLM